MTVFDVFEEVPFTYIVLSRGTVYGNEPQSKKCLSGIFKLREGKEETASNGELPISSATLHVHPEDFDNPNGIVGNAVRINGITYDITNMTKGTNFDNGNSEHYTLTLQRTDLAQGE